MPILLCAIFSDRSSRAMTWLFVAAEVTPAVQKASPKARIETNALRVRGGIIVLLCLSGIRNGLNGEELYFVAMPDRPSHQVGGGCVAPEQWILRVLNYLRGRTGDNGLVTGFLEVNQ